MMVAERERVAERDSKITGLLDGIAARPERVGAGSWNVSLAEGHPRATVEVRDDWLIIEQGIAGLRDKGTAGVDEPADGAAARPLGLEEGLIAVGGSKPGNHDLDRWGLIERNGTLGGLAKFVLEEKSDGVGEFRLRAEIPIDVNHINHVDAERLYLEERLRESCDAMGAALDGIHTPILESAGGARGDGDLTVRVDGAVLEIAEQIRELDWSCEEKDPGLLVVDLQIPGRPAQITVEETGPHGIRAAVGLTRDPLSPLSRRAVATLLLFGSSLVRMIRASARPIGRVTPVAGPVPLAPDDPVPTAEASPTRTRDDGTVQFEVAFEVVMASPRAEELDHALSALSLAYERFSREASILQDETIARAYLAWAPGSTVVTTETKTKT